MNHAEDFEVFCYADVPAEDNTTSKLRSHVEQWRDIFGQSDERVTQLIAEDQIDILVDLAGHTAHNRLGVFARKPAPIQVTYLGDATTTGLSSMDYRITDPWADPWFEENYCRETLIRLPSGFVVFQPPESAPAVEELPALKNDYVTFGSFNHLAKVTPDVIRVWSELLQRVPASKLLIKAGGLRDGVVLERLRQQFLDQGIEADRLELLGQVENFQEHLSLYHKVDIALDPFPYAGTTTSCEAFWMGVPVVTLSGETHVSRVGVSLLTQLGLNEFITHSDRQYRQVAEKLAKDLDSLGQIRSGLRPAMAASSLCDGGGLTRRLENRLSQDVAYLVRRVDDHQPLNPPGRLRNGSP